MARKNLFSLAPDSEAPVTSENALAETRPLANFEKPLRRSGAVGAISQSLGGLTERAQRVAEMEEKLSKGLAVVELDPGVIDSSFIADRLEIDPEGLADLVAQIREHGQQVPILVRPNPKSEGRYQVAYGHRRLAAARELGIPVRAVVRDLSDEQLVVSQGQENNSRTDLSYIERSFFAFRLEKLDFSRDTIMAALGVDKAALSRMIALVASLPGELIEAVGPAPGFGRTRWAELADLLAEKGRADRARHAVKEAAFLALSSDERFQRLYDLLRQAPQKPRSEIWKDTGGRKLVRISENDQKLTLVFDKIQDEGFGSFVETQLAALFREFEERKNGND